MKSIGLRIQVLLFFSVLLSSILAQEQNEKDFPIQRDLKEVIVIGDSISHYADKDVIRITKYMRRGSYNTGDMLNKVPGISYNRVTGSLSYQGDKNICLLVDSLPKDEGYVKQLGHLRFEKVEIIQNPRGKYADYDYIINLRTRKHYEGHENNFYLNTNIFPNNDNGRRKQLAGLNASDGFTYTKDKWNFVLFYSLLFGQGDRNSYYKKIFQDNDYKEFVIKNANGSNNQDFTNRQHQIGTSIDYQFNQKNSLSIAYGLELTDNDRNFNRSLIKSNLEDTNYQTYRHYTATKDNGIRQGVGLYYRGGYEVWNYNLTFNFFHRDWDTGYALRKSTGYTLDDNRRQYMNHTFAQVDGDRRFFDNKLYWSLSYIHFWRQYDQYQQAFGNLLSKNTLMYHQVGSYMSFQTSKRTSFHLSAYVRSIQSKALLGNGDCYLTFHGSAGLYRNFGKVGWARINYNCNTGNPSLSQTSSYGTFTDSLIWSAGNPMLRTSIEHSAQFRFCFKNMLTFSTGVLYSPRRYMRIMNQTEGYLQNGIWGNYLTVQDQTGEYFSYWTRLNFNANYRNLSMDATILYSHRNSCYLDYSHSNGGLGGNLQIIYMMMRKNIHFALNYNCDNVYNVSAQSKSTGYGDRITVSAIKTFYKERLRLALQYTLPIGFKFNKWTEKLESPGYMYYFNQDTEKYNRNHFSFSLSYRISGGQSVRQYKREMSEER